jgi:hypothetical protein
MSDMHLIFSQFQSLSFTLSEEHLKSKSWGRYLFLRKINEWGMVDCRWIAIRSVENVHDHLIRYSGAAI